MFCNSLGDAEEILLHAALINKNMGDTNLSIHRLVQASVIRRLDDSERSKHFDTIVQMLNWGFPDTWSQDIGHQFQAWTKCDMCLPHVNHLAKQATRYKITSKKPQVYGELLLRCSWYFDHFIPPNSLTNPRIIGICMNENSTMLPGLS